MIKKLLIILTFLILPQVAGATAYYVDFSATNGIFDGLATTTAFSSLDAFTEVARSAGDIAFVRRGVASTTALSTLTFTSDGTSVSPIIISADYDNLWSDFATSSQTYSVAVATSTFYASASITGIATGDWIYVAGDCFETYNSTSLNQCEFAYEVKTVSGTALSLYLPYKGNQSGSVLDLRVMPDNPIHGAINGAISDWLIVTDNNWSFFGLHVRHQCGGASDEAISNTDSVGTYFSDMILECGTGLASLAILNLEAGANSVVINKTRFYKTFGNTSAVQLIDVNGDSYNYVKITDSLFTDLDYDPTSMLFFNKIVQRL